MSEKIKKSDSRLKLCAKRLKASACFSPRSAPGCAGTVWQAETIIAVVSDFGKDLFGSYSVSRWSTL
jgi:hypothetical protein